MMTFEQATGFAARVSEEAGGKLRVIEGKAIKIVFEGDFWGQTVVEF